MWEQLTKLFGEKSTNAKFSLKLQLFKLKMYEETYLSSHINEPNSLMRQLTEIKAPNEEDDAKAILLNSLSSNYDNTIFTKCQFSTKSLDEMIAALLEKEKRLKQGNTYIHPQIEIA